MVGKKILSLLETPTFPFNTFSVTSYSVQAKTKSLCHAVGTASLLLMLTHQSRRYSFAQCALFWRSCCQTTVQPCNRVQLAIEFHVSLPLSLSPSLSHARTQADSDARSRGQPLSPNKSQLRRVELKSLHAPTLWFDHLRRGTQLQSHRLTFSTSRSRASYLELELSQRTFLLPVLCWWFCIHSDYSAVTLPFWTAN